MVPVFSGFMPWQVWMTLRLAASRKSAETSMPSKKQLSGPSLQHCLT